jgi:trk system potassium uptake protein
LSQYIKNLKSSQIIVYSFFLLIIIGTALLSLPAATIQDESIGVINALFTATSALSVTGLAVVTTYYQWTTFGKLVILALIQIGGLGIITIIMTIYISIGKKITLKERLVIQESLNQKDIKGMVSLVKRIILGTIFIEIVASILLSIIFIKNMEVTLLKGMGMGTFHAISAFSNAGFDIVGESSLSPFKTHTIFNIIIMSLIVVGGIGFIVWVDIISNVKKRYKNNKFYFKSFLSDLSLHTKIVLEVSIALIVIGTLTFYLAEMNNPKTLGELTVQERFIASLFQAITPRTAGFFTVPQEYLTPTSQIFTVILMFIGGSPGSTAGGIKTITLGIIIITILSILKGENEIVAHKRAIPIYIVQKSLAIVILNFMVILIATVILSVSEKELIVQGFTLWDIIFEVVSSVGTAGLSLGITPYLSDFGKIIVSICMAIGRLGPITVAVGLTERRLNKSKGVKHPEEKVLVG